MATKKATSPAKSNPGAFKVVEGKDTRSQTLAKLVTSGVLSAATLKQYSGAGEDLEVSDLVAGMKKAGDEAVAGDMKGVERMLTMVQDPDTQFGGQVNIALPGLAQPRSRARTSRLQCYLDIC